MISVTRNQFTTLSLAIAVGFAGTIAATNSPFFGKFKPFPNAEFAGQYPENTTIGGEHPTHIIVQGDDRSVFPRSDKIRFSIANNFPKTASISYSTLLTDEEGNELLSEPTSPVVKLAHGTTSTFSFGVPDYLGEGMYTLQITALGMSQGEFADSGIELNFAVLSDSIYLLTNEEWLELSLSNGAAPE